MKDSRQIPGINSLGYQGINPENPPQLFVEKRNPTVQDYRNKKIGDIWINYLTNYTFMLADFVASLNATGKKVFEAIWVLLYPSSGGAEMFDTNAGMVVPNASNKIQVLGGTNLNTSGAGNTVTINLDNNLSISGSLSIPSIDEGVVQTDSNGEFFTSVGNNGEVLIGGGTEPQWANITSGTITINNGPNSIDLSASGVGEADFVTNSGTATPDNNTIVFAGGSNINTSGTGNTITIKLDNNVSISGNLTVTNDLTTSNIDIDGLVGFSSFSDGVVQSNSGALSSSAGNDGEVLIADSTGTPAYATIASSDLSVSITNGANTINIEDAGFTGAPYAFLAIQASTLNLGARQPFQYLMGSEVALTEIFDDGNGFFPGDGAGNEAIYTAAADGRYAFFFYVTVQSVEDSPVVPGQTYLTLVLVASNASEYYGEDQYYITNNPYGNIVLKKSINIPLDMGDTVRFYIGFRQAFSSASIYGANGSEPITWISGFYTGDKP